MNILVLNSGSSSVKYKLIDTDGEGKTLAEGGAEKLGLDDAFLKYKRKDGSKATIELGRADHTAAIRAILNLLTDKEEGCIRSFDQIDAVGHRVVHGAEKFSKSVLINDEVKDEIRRCYDIAPLHNPANMTGIEAVETIMPNVPQVAVFDTAFHQTMPAKSYLYALPYRFYKEDGVRRYGFHGTSHRYVSQRVCEYLGVNPAEKKIITCHIGNGASIAAVNCGKCVDTTMGLTPLEGLMMGTRSGDIDAGAATFLMDKLNLDTKGLSNLLNKQSGLAGVSGLTSDFRDILAGEKAGNNRARLAKQMYTYRIKKYIGAYAAAMGGVDIILFTGGAGENQWEVREGATSGLEFMGVRMDADKNRACRATEAIISADGSPVTVCVIPTDEELMIALDTQALTK